MVKKNPVLKWDLKFSENVFFCGSFSDKAFKKVISIPVMMTSKTNVIFQKSFLKSFSVSQRNEKKKEKRKKKKEKYLTGKTRQIWVWVRLSN